MRYEQTVQVETSEYICLVKRIDGLVIQKALVSELIRCKDCKHGQKRTNPYMYCDIFGAVTETEWFCSKAERKEE